MKKNGWIRISFIILAISFMSITYAAGKYSIIHETAKVRDDGGKNYYVLVKPVNLKNDRFKKDIQQLITEVAKQKGKEITIDIFDDQKLLENFYQYQLKSLVKPESKAEVRHHIARFIDQRGYGTYLFYFPAMHVSNNDPKTYGKYYDFFIFDPYK